MLTNSLELVVLSFGYFNFHSHSSSEAAIERYISYSIYTVHIRLVL